MVIGFAVEDRRRREVEDRWCREVALLDERTIYQPRRPCVPQISRACDVWSAACCIIEAVGGAVPWDGLNQVNYPLAARLEMGFL